MHDEGCLCLLVLMEAQGRRNRGHEGISEHVDIEQRSKSMAKGSGVASMNLMNFGLHPSDGAF